MEFFPLIVIVVFGILFYFLKDKIFLFLQKEEEVKLPFEKKDFLLNTSERIFFEKLQQIIPDDFIVFPQILLSNIVCVKSSKKDFWKYQNKINRKTIDFVIFEKKDLKPILALEYDGKTHNRIDRQERDLFVNKVLESSGISILHTEHQKNINFEEVENQINKFLRPSKKDTKITPLS